jgi:putative ABC transport system substrate-binding protein
VPSLFVAVLITSFFAALLAADAQQPVKVSRIGYLGGSPSSPLLEPFRQGLRDLGWIEGQNIAIEYRWTEGRAERFPEIVAELVRLNVDVIYTQGSNAAALVAKQATGTIPIVFTTPADPLAVGLVPSLARPGGNVTGLGGGADSLKRLDLLKEVVPKITRLAILWNPANPSNQASLKETEEAAKTSGVTLQALAVREPADLDGAFSAMTRERADALLLFGDPLFFVQRAQIVELAAKHRVATMYNRAEYVKAGGLLAYATDDIEQERRAAVYVDKILRGTKPGDLPVERPTKFELVVNLKTAKALGIKLPATILASATEVIE